MASSLSWIKQMSNRLIFFGTEEFSATSLRALIDAGFPIAAVVTKPDFKRGRKQVLTQPVVKTIALDHNIPVWQPEKLKDITQDIMMLQPVTGVLVSYGKIIPQSIIDLFEPGIINVHPSLLPAYRGASPIESAILHGDSKTGVSLMQLSAQMDAGPVYIQETIELSGNENKTDLYKKLALIGSSMLTKNLHNISDRALLPTPQDESLATYTKLLKKEEGLLLPSVKSAQKLEREVRAYQGYPKSRYTIYNYDCVITSVRVAQDAEDGDLIIPCADDSWLEIKSLVGPSGRLMTGADFIRGYKKD
jgi:methionyl-tRNA formyltransferase